jgi:NADH-quinone oxidoreductase subunit N
VNLELFVPELILAGTALAVILLDLFLRSKAWLTVVSIAGIATVFGFTVAMWGGEPQSVWNGMLVADSFALFFKTLLLFIAALVILASVEYSSRFPRFNGEYQALVLLATLGMMLMTAATDLITIFVSLELTAISFYVLVGFLRDSRSTEASLKFVLLGGVASAVLLFGMALAFGFTGQTQLVEIARVIQDLSPEGMMVIPGLVLGIVLMMAGFGFKIAAVPFQMWAPDIYEGAPTPITLFLSVASKAAGFAVILRVFFTAFGLPEFLSQNWGMTFAVLSALGMILGNATALVQSNIKRMLAYSSIAHSGYIMIGLAVVGLSLASSQVGQSSLLFYVAAFVLADLAAFIAIIAISSRLKSDLIKDYAGMGRRSPLLAVVLTLGLISLIGLPPAVGFMAKFYIFTEAVSSGLLWLVIIAVINSVVAAYYYFRVIRVMWLGEPASDDKMPVSPVMKLVLAVSSLGILVFGIAPAFLMGLARTAAGI